MQRYKETFGSQLGDIPVFHNTPKWMINCKVVFGSIMKFSISKVSSRIK